MIGSRPNTHRHGTLDHRVAAITAIAITLLQLVALQRLTSMQPVMDRTARPALHFLERIARHTPVHGHAVVATGEARTAARRRADHKQDLRRAPAPALVSPSVTPPLIRPPTQEASHPPLGDISAGGSNWRVEDPAVRPSISFRKDIMSRDPSTLEPPRSRRFRMKPQLTPRDIVRGASQLLGFWPPGYSDNPCGGLNRSVQQLSSPANASERRQLAMALELRQKHCP